MDNNDRLHALDAVRAFALLLGVVLHAAAAFLQNFPLAIWQDTPSAGAAVLYYTIHMFRMSAFFLIAGLFARLVLQRRGTDAFIRDRANRIGVPLLFTPIVVGLIPLAYVLGNLPHLLVSTPEEFAQSLPKPTYEGGLPPAASGLSLAHMWFLYYLLLFYALALGVRAVMQKIDPQQTIARWCDRVIAFALRGPAGPLLVAVPLALYLSLIANWNEWLGLPAPQSLLPDIVALVGYGLAFTFGWLLHRQLPLLRGMQRFWQLHLLLALLLSAACLMMIGTTPRWLGSNLTGSARVLYALAYCIGMWCWIFALIGIAMRYLSVANPWIRYLADASYWIYVMHLTTIIFLLALLRPYDLHWSLKLGIMVGGSLSLLLMTYHYLVRFTPIGAILNGKAHQRQRAAS